jgi:hypothetical protein
MPEKSRRPGRPEGRRRIPAAPALALAALLAALAAARAGEKPPPPKISVPIMKASELKPGMKGYGLTCFRGTKPERFDVEIVDVLRKAFPKHDLILIKCSHPVIEKAHVIAGMSGSPIYIDDKLIGALAYGWWFTKEPIAGVTPIEWMLEEMAEPKPAEKQAGARLRAPPALAAAPTAPTGRAPARVADLRGLKPLSLPVCASGMAGLPPRAVAKFREMLAECGLELAEGAAGNAAGEEIGPDALVPGAPLGVALMRGDISFTGIGTLTHREGDRIIAFGHPMLFSGQEVAMPLTTAFIHGVMPSSMRSFKLGSPSQSAGTLTQDRYPAVAGTLGRECPMIKLRAEIDNPTSGNAEKLDVEMIDSRTISPMLLRIACADLLLLEGVAWTDFVVDYSLDVEFEKHGKLHLEGMDMAFWGFIVSEPSYALSRLMNNSFEPMHPRSISVRMKAVHKRIDAKIQRAWLEQLEVRPGKEVKLHIRVNPYDGKAREIVFPIRIPPHLDEGKYDLVVGGGGNWAVQLPTPPAESVEDIFTQLKMRYRPTTAVAVLKLPSVGVGFKGHLYRQLPSSVFGTLVSGSSAGVATFQDGLHFTHETGWYLTGETQRLKIVVKQSAEDEK